MNDQIDFLGISFSFEVCNLKEEQSGRYCEWVTEQLFLVAVFSLIFWHLCFPVFYAAKLVVT